MPTGRFPSKTALLAQPDRRHRPRGACAQGWPTTTIPPRDRLFDVLMRRFDCAADRGARAWSPFCATCRAIRPALLGLLPRFASVDGLDAGDRRRLLRRPRRLHCGSRALGAGLPRMRCGSGSTTTAPTWRGPWRRSTRRLRRAERLARSLPGQAGERVAAKPPAAAELRPPASPTREPPAAPPT